MMKNINTHSDPYNHNPVVYSQNCHYRLPFGKNAMDLRDPEVFEGILKSGIDMFRRSRVYSNYKMYLISLGLDRCQLRGNITSEMAPIEMHHNILTIHDIGTIILNHLKNNNILVTSFDIFNILRYEHINNMVQVIMINETDHQIYHGSAKLFIHPNQTFGNWIDFLYRYNSGITLGIAYKLIRVIDQAIINGETVDDNVLEIRKNIKKYSDIYARYNYEYNE